MKATRSILLVALVAAGCGGGSASTPPASTPAKGVPVRTARVEARDVENALVLTGSLRPRRQVEVVAEVAARLVRVAYDEGSRVAADETLAILDETDYALALERAQAALAVAEANRAHAFVEKERADNLLKTGGITDKDRLAAEVGLQVAEASLAQAKVETAIAEKQRSRTLVRAPFAGRVARRYVDPGTMLANGTRLFTLVDDNAFEFRASLPSADYGRVKVGALVEMALDVLPGLAAAGRVTRVTPLIDEKTRAFEVVVEVPGRAELVGGSFARAKLHVSQARGALVVPPSAIVRDGADASRAAVFAVVDGKASRRSVVLGFESADAVQVTEGLAAGDVVIVDPPAALGDGAPVDVGAATSTAGRETPGGKAP